MKIVKEFEIIHPAQELNEAPKITREHMNCMLHYDYETESGYYDWKTICFVKAISYRFKTASACSVDMISAYNSIGRVTNSGWLKELKGNTEMLNEEYKHFIVYFDEYGCYEFIAKNFIA